MHLVKLPLLLLLLCSLGLSQAGLTHRRLRETVPAGAPPANTVIISEPASDLRKDQIPVTIIQEAAPETPAIVPQKDEPEQKLRTEAEKANEIASEPVVVATEIKDEKPITELRAADVEPVVPDENDDAPEVYTEILFVDGDAPSDDLSVRQGTPATPASTTQGNFVQQLIQNSPIGQFFNQLTGQQQQQQQQQDAQVSADEPAATPAPTIPGFLNPQAAITSAQQAVQNAAQFVGNTTTQAFQGLQQFATNLGTQFQNTLSNFGGNQQQGTSDSTTPRPPGPIQSVINNFIGGNNNNQSAAPVAGQGTNPLQGIISFFQGGNRPAQAAAANTPAISESPAATEPEKPSRLDDKIEESQEISEQQQAELDATNEVRNSQEVVGGGNEDSFEEIKPEEVIVVNDDASEQRV